MADPELYEFKPEIMGAWLIDKDNNYAIPDPNDHLIDIYETDTLKDSLLIRAEKWESPEHQKDPELKKALNVQNPNYNKMLDMLKTLRKLSAEYKKTKKPEVEEKLNKHWLTFIQFVKDIASSQSSRSETIIKIYKFTVLPDVRLLRFMLSKTEPCINEEILSLLMSYFFCKYVGDATQR
jgi:hypothetical protein